MPNFSCRERETHAGDQTINKYYNTKTKKLSGTKQQDSRMFANMVANDRGLPMQNNHRDLPSHTRYLGPQSVKKVPTGSSMQGPGLIEKESRRGGRPRRLCL